MNSSLPEEPVPIGLVTLLLDFVPKRWVGGEATDSINQTHAPKSQLGLFLRAPSFLAVSFIANKVDPHVLRVFSV
jgi:hypothetical protein